MGRVCRTQFLMSPPGSLDTKLVERSTKLLNILHYWPPDLSPGSVSAECLYLHFSKVHPREITGDWRENLRESKVVTKKF